MADILISKFTTQIPRVGATPATPGFAESEGQDPVAPSGTPQVYTPVTIGSPANGLSISGTQVLTIGLASTSATGALSSTDWNTFNNKLNLTSPITGYTVGANTALAATDTILQAFGKVQGQINARISGTIASGQVAFGTGVNTLGGDSGFVWDNTNKRIDVGASQANKAIFRSTVAAGNNFIDFVNTTGRQSYIGMGTANDDFFIVNAKNNAITFATNNTNRWQILSTGVFQSNGAQTINALGGELRLTTSGGTNSNIIIAPQGTGLVMVGPSGTPTNTLDVNGTARIRTISNLGTAATSVLVPSATGVVSLRTLAELASDGLGSKWTDVTGGIFRNGAVAIGRTTIPTNATFAVQSLTATASHQFFQLLNNSGTVLGSISQDGSFAVNTSPVTNVAGVFRAFTDTTGTVALRALNSSSSTIWEVTGASIRGNVPASFGNFSPEAGVSFSIRPLSFNIAMRVFNADSTVRVMDLMGDTGNIQSRGGAFFGSANTGTAPTARLDVRGAGTTTGLTMLLEDSAGTNNAEFVDNGQIRFLRLPTSSAGLAAGSLWNNGGVLNIV